MKKKIEENKDDLTSSDSENEPKIGSDVIFWDEEEIRKL